MKRRLSGILALLVLLVPATPRAGDGDPDPTFGISGVAAWPVEGSWPEANAVEILSDGRVLSSGQFRRQTVLVRSTSDGLPDPSWGSSGAVQLQIGEATAMVLQADEKALTSGEGIARFDTSGNLDASFGDAGVADATTRFLSVAVQPDGRIVALTNGGGVRRLQSDGIPDATFGVGGTADVSHLAVGRLAVQTDGKILLLGSTDVGQEISRLTPDGEIDPSWGTAGTVVVPDFHVCESQGNDFDAAGRLVVAGCHHTPNLFGPLRTLAVARFDTDGSLDTSFGASGIAHVPVGGGGRYQSWAKDIAILSDGRILAVGDARNGVFVDGDPVTILLLRLLPDGTLDTSLNGTGYQTGPAYTRAKAVAVQADGKTVLVGRSGDSIHHSPISVFRFGGEICGNGGIDPGEACDDGNFDDGDCCSSACQVSNVGGTCMDDGDPCSTDTCDATGDCVHAPGNDGAACDDDGEQCTDDVCSTGVCTHPARADGIACEDGEECTEGDFCEAGACRHGVGTLTCNENEYSCYRATVAEENTPAFSIPPLLLTDEVQSSTYAVPKADGLCLPARVTTQPANYVAHFRTYKVKPATRQDRHARIRNVAVTDRFGTWSLDVMNANRLLSPALATSSFVANLGVPDPILANHHTCHRVRRSKGSPRLSKGKSVNVSDSIVNRRYLVRRAVQLCLAADAGTGIPDPSGHLLCYSVRPEFGHPRGDRLRTRDGFSEDELHMDTRQLDTICLPASVDLP